MALLAGGVAVTLVLTSHAISVSYRLEKLHEQNARLAERVAELQRVVAKRESPTWLAEQASRLGMVPAGLPAKLVLRPNGTIRLVGEPHVVTAPSTPPSSPPPSSSSSSPSPQQEPRDTDSEGEQDADEDDESTDQKTAPTGAGG